MHQVVYDQRIYNKGEQIATYSNEGYSNKLSDANIGVLKDERLQN